jgi:hypothetical protein
MDKVKIFDSKKLKIKIGKIENINEPYIPAYVLLGLIFEIFFPPKNLPTK